LTDINFSGYDAYSGGLLTVEAQDYLNATFNCAY